MIDKGQEQIKELDFIETWLILRRYAKLLALVFFVAVVLSGIVTYFLIPKKYQSGVTFYLQDSNQSSSLSLLSSQLGGLGGLMPGLGNGTNADLCSEIILARDFLKNVLRDERLPSKSEDVKKFQSAISVTKKKTGALNISVIWDNPRTVYRLTNRIFEHYKKFVDEQVNVNNSVNRKFLEAQYDKSKERLAKSENALLKYQKEKGILLLPDEATKAIEYFADLEKQKLEVETQLNEAKHRLSEAESILEKKDPELKASVSEDINPIIQEYKSKLVEIEVELAKVKETYTDQHPAVRSLLKQQEELLARIEEEKNQIHSPDIAAEYLKGLIEVTGLEARKVSLDKIYSESHREITGLPDELLTYGQLVREQKVAEQIYMLLTSQYEQAKVAEAKENNVVIQMIDPPVIPEKKYSPSTVINMAIAGILALVLCFGYILFQESFKNYKRGVNIDLL